jgi:hypothetical protein
MPIPDEVWDPEISWPSRDRKSAGVCGWGDAAYVIGITKMRRSKTVHSTIELGTTGAASPMSSNSIDYIV